MTLCFDKICRTCMTEAPALLSMYSFLEEKCEMSDNEHSVAPTIMDMLMSITLAAKTEGLPENICISCINELNRAYMFKQKCERTELTLKNYLEQIDLVVQPHRAQEEVIGTVAKHESILLPDLKEITHLLKTEEQEVLDQSFIEKNNTMVIKKQVSMITEEAITIVDTNEKIIITDFQCLNCCKKYVSEQELQDHIQVEHASIYCSECGVYFKSSLELKKHEKDLHKIRSSGKESKKIIKCSQCGIEFVHPKNLEKHVLKYHTIIEQISDTLEEREQELHEQTEIDIINDNQNDDIDESKMSQLELINVPEKSVVETNFRCKKCGACFAKEKSLNIHQKSNKCMEKSFQCNICNRVFVRKKNLLLHIMTHDDKKPYKCTECPKAFNRQDQLASHLTNHTGIKKHQCPHCSKGFNMISTLKDHIRTHNGERPYLCSICGKGFSQSTNLKQHIMRHTQTKPFKCSTCSYAFVSKGELDAHLRKHTGDHPFVCDVCGTGFTTSSSLVKHKRIHTGERPYACEFCPMRFTALGTLKNHRRTHTGERPFGCKFCDRTFAQKSDMVSHTRTHTGERPYVCSVCGLAFLQSSTLKSHSKTHQTRMTNSLTVTPQSLNVATIPMLSKDFRSSIVQ